MNGFSCNWFRIQAIHSTAGLPDGSLDNLPKREIIYQMTPINSKLL
jgi:hypothetical protein